MGEARPHAAETYQNVKGERMTAVVPKIGSRWLLKRENRVVIVERVGDMEVGWRYADDPSASCLHWSDAFDFVVWHNFAPLE